jgi:hypothetical protein
MNNEQLDRLLRSTRPPTRPASYWDSFPETVQRRLARESGPRAEDSPRRSHSWFPLPWLAVGAAAIAVGLLLLGRPARPTQPTEFTASELQSYGEIWRQVTALFPHQVSAVILGPDGPQVVLSDQPNLPVSPPVVLRRCAADGCRTALTFSGQSVHLGNRQLEVLTDSRGGVIVTDEDSVWPSVNGSLRLNARLLETTL